MRANGYQKYLYQIPSTSFKTSPLTSIQVASSSNPSNQSEATMSKRSPAQTPRWLFIMDPEGSDDKHFCVSLPSLGDSPRGHHICECIAHPLHKYRYVLAPTLLALALRCRATQHRRLALTPRHYTLLLLALAPSRYPLLLHDRNTLLACTANLRWLPATATRYCYPPLLHATRYCYTLLALVPRRYPLLLPATHVCAANLRRIATRYRYTLPATATRYPLPLHATRYRYPLPLHATRHSRMRHQTAPCHLLLTGTRGAALLLPIYMRAIAAAFSPSLASQRESTPTHAAMCPATSPALPTTNISETDSISTAFTICEF
ncbi:hypothetical protein K438DRAFT_1997936 [Mycena galopus ATCC 62051]|nr:hypothetical protein K438DRAFT_1997936 [Mycena galopus ATCC 62051]